MKKINYSIVTLNNYLLYNMKKYTICSACFAKNYRRGWVQFRYKEKTNDFRCIFCKELNRENRS